MSLCNFPQASRSDLTKRIPELLQGMDGVGKVGVSLATVSLQIGCRGPHGRCICAGEPACSSAVGGPGLSACIGLSLRGAQCGHWYEKQDCGRDGSEPWPLVCVSPGGVWGTVESCILCSLVCALLKLQFWRRHQPGSQGTGGEDSMDMQGTVGCCRGPGERAALLLL